MRVKFGILIVLILAFWTFRPLFEKGLFPIHDDTQVGRVIQMKKALSDGHFPVRWSADLGYGYGYPLFNFYAPVPYYLGGLADYFLENPILATKFMYFLGIVFSGIFMFSLLKEFVNTQGALISAILYMYAPYHAVQIYVRGAVGEYWAYGFLPAALWGIYKAIKTKKTPWVIGSALFISILILSHNIISMLFVIFLFLAVIILTIYFLVSCGSLKKVLPLILSITLGLSLSSFFILPAIFESKYTNVVSITQGGSNFRDHFLFLDQLWDSPWGFAGSAPGREDGMSFKLGKIQVVLGFLGLVSVYWLKFKRKIETLDFLFIQAVILFLFISLLMTQPQSLFIWDAASQVLKYVQFPWRFLVFIILGISFLSGFLFGAIPDKKVSYFLGGLIIFLTIFYNAKYFRPQYLINLTNKDYREEDYLKWTVSKISDEYLPKEFVKPEGEKKIAQDILTYVEKKTDKLRFFLNQDSERELVLNLTYFPGWSGYIDGRETKVKSNKGLVSIFVPSGSHEIVLLLKSTPIQIIGNTLTIITLLGILLKSKNIHEKYSG